MKCAIVNKVLAFVAVRAFLTLDVPIRRGAPIDRLRRPVPILNVFVDVVFVQIRQPRVTNQENDNRTDERDDLRTCAQWTKYKDHRRNSCYDLDDGHNNRLIELMVLGGRLTSWVLDCTKGTGGRSAAPHFVQKMSPVSARVPHWAQSLSVTMFRVVSSIKPYHNSTA